MNVLGYNISTTLISYPVSKKIIVNTINPHSYCIAKRDPFFAEALKKSDVLLPDGIGIVVAAKILLNKKIPRITGSDLHQHLLEETQKNGLKVFYLGSIQSTLEWIEKKVKKEYPKASVSTYSPPFKAEFSAEDNRVMIEEVNSFSPDILFIGMTAPKQEKWAYLNKDQLNAKIICSIGAVFDFYAGTVKRAPLWMQNNGVEWIHRSITLPKRLGRRNITSNPEFIIDLIKYKIGYLK